MSNTFRILLFFTVAILGSSSLSIVSAQSWGYDMGALPNTTSAPFIKQMDIATDGSIFCVGEDQFVGNVIARFSPQGLLIFSDTMPGYGNRRIHAMAAGGPNTIVIGGDEGSFLSSSLWKVDSTGQNSILLAPFGVLGEVRFSGLHFFPGKGFGGFGRVGPSTNYSAFAYFLDTNATPIWFHNLGSNTSSTEATAMCEDGAGGFYVASHAISNGNIYNPIPRLTRFTGAGDSLWTRPLPSQFALVNDMILTDDGDLLLSGARDTVGYQQDCQVNEIKETALLAKIDTLGNFIWEYEISDCNFDPQTGIDQAGLRLTRNDNGELLWAGIRIRYRFEVWITPFQSFYFDLAQPSVTLLDSSGYPSIHHPYHLNFISTEFYHDFEFASNGQMLQLWVVPGGIDGFNALFSPPVLHPSGYLAGTNLGVRFYYDPDTNCTQEPFSNIPTLPVSLSPNPYSTQFSNDGFNYLEVPTDTYQISLDTTTNPYWRQSCPTNPDYLELFVADTLERVAIGLRPVVSCPLLRVDIGSYPLRPCTNSQVTVLCSNEGTIASDTPYVEVDFDPSLTVVSSTLPWVGTPVNNRYRFDLDTLIPGDQVSFSVNVMVDCSVQMGQALCNEASIFPDSFCTPSAVWDEVSLVASAKCNLNGDTILFNVRNVGVGNMNSGGTVLVLEDNVLKLQFPVQLQAGQDTSFYELATGGTWYIRANQSPGHPSSTFSADVLEACGTDTLGNFSIGYATGHPLSDWNYFNDAHCQVVTNSFDPNDKIGYPTGMGPDHLIDSTTRINYVIRFQNTGTDTAFNVMIRDTLPEEMLGTSFVPGVSSHPYIVAYLPGGVVQFHFWDIMLPDSGTNMVESQGFVQYRMDQQPGNLSGTVIENDADIYFDFNPGINTGTYSHMIDSGRVMIAIAESSEPKIELEIGPNPFGSVIRFRRSPSILGIADFRIVNLSGQLVHQQQVDSSEWRFQSASLPPGIYVFMYEDTEGNRVTGKIVKRPGR